jgi:hypothetical protein
MSVIIIGGGDGVRSAVTDIENASIGWTQAKRDAAEALLAQCATCLKAVADGGDAAAVTITGP